MAKTYEFDSGQDDIAINDRVISESEVTTHTTKTSISRLEAELAMLESTITSMTEQKDALAAKLVAIKAALDVD